MHSHVRFAAAASLIAFGSIIGGGALVLVPPAVDRLLVARAGMSHPPAPCERQAWPHSDRDCLSVTPPPRDLPRIAAHGSLDAVTATTQIPAQAPAQVAAQVPIQVTAQVPIHVPAQAPSPVERAPEQPLPESRHAAAAPPELARPSFITEPAQGTPAPPLVAAKPPSAKPAVASRRARLNRERQFAGIRPPSDLRPSRDPRQQPNGRRKRPWASCGGSATP